MKEVLKALGKINPATVAPVLFAVAGIEIGVVMVLWRMETKLDKIQRGLSMKFGELYFE